MTVRDLIVELLDCAKPDWEVFIEVSYKDLSMLEEVRAEPVGEYVSFVLGGHVR